MLSLLFRISNFDVPQHGPRPDPHGDHPKERCVDVVRDPDLRNKPRHHPRADSQNHHPQDHIDGATLSFSEMDIATMPPSHTAGDYQDQEPVASKEKHVLHIWARLGKQPRHEDPHD